MKRLVLFGLLPVAAAAGFLAGGLRSGSLLAAPPAETARTILYYVDPMNPAHTSDRPGLAPCGMKMEPVYADATALRHPPGDDQGTVAPGAVKISPERQQLAGIRVAEVERTRPSYSLRLPGRVTVDETRVYRIKAALSGWIEQTLPCSTGSAVEKEEVLAHLNSPELLPAVQSLLLALNTRKKPAARADLATTDSVFEFDLSYQQSLDALRHMGMGQRQLDEVIRSRKFVKNLEVTSPAKGVVLSRSVADELHVEKGDELFRVADLSRVWILADVSGRESEYLTPGTRVEVFAPRNSRSFAATVGRALPLFEKDSQTLKVRLEMDNPDYALRPDMLVDLELPLELPEMLLVNADAVLDTGRRQTVFLDRGGGLFEPAEVKTGRRFGEHVEVIDGLMPGDRIVVSGNFLLDSESRMKMAAANIARRPEAKDPVCGMTVDEQAARAAGRVCEHKGQTFFFCNDSCKRSFDADPRAFLNSPGARAARAADTTPQAARASLP